MSLFRPNAAVCCSADDVISTCCLLLRMRCTSTAEGGWGVENEWEGRGAAIGGVRSKHNCDEALTPPASSYSLVYSLVTVRERGHGHTLGAD